jgi:hypothetical protein
MSSVPNAAIANLRLLRHVRLHRDRFRAGRLDLGDHFLRRRLAGHPVDRDIGAGFSQRDRDRLADSGIRPRHQRGLALQDRKIRCFWQARGIETHRHGDTPIAGLEA